MKPYYSHAGITIFHGDCREVLPTLPVGFCATCEEALQDEQLLAIHLAGNHEVRPFIDAVVSDPPYGMNWDGRVTSGPNSNSWAGAKSWSFGETIIGDDEPFDPSNLLIYPEVILWGFNHFCHALRPGTALVWIKRHDDAFGSFLSDAEVAWMKGGRGAYCYKDVGYKTTEDRYHPTQKPLGLMRWCVSKTSGHMVADPYMGSGTTLVAAKEQGKSAIGIEIEEKYCEIAAKRLSQEVFSFTDLESRSGGGESQ